MDLSEVRDGKNVLKVFAATKARDRAVLGERVTEWLRENGLEGVECEVRQSSDAEFHMISIVVLAERAGPKRRRRR